MRQAGLSDTPLSSSDRQAPIKSFSVRSAAPKAGHIAERPRRNGHETSHDPKHPHRDTNPKKDAAACKISLARERRALFPQRRDLGPQLLARTGQHRHGRPREDLPHPPVERHWLHADPQRQPLTQPTGLIRTTLSNHEPNGPILELRRVLRNPRCARILSATRRKQGDGLIARGWRIVEVRWSLCEC